MPAARRAALVISVVAGACVTLAGCSGSSSSSTAAGPNHPVAVDTSPAPVPSTSGQLTGKFCNDFKSIAAIARLPANATGSLSELQKNGVPALNKAVTYFDGLAAEAPPKPAQALRVIAADYKAMAASISSGNTDSLSKAASQIANLTTNGSSGDAFRQLITYSLTKCLAA
jgi:hypothetical protein